MTPKAPKIQPPFQALHKHVALLGLLIAVLVALYLRVYQLSTLPPGVSDAGAAVGLQARALLEHGTLPGLSAANWYAPFWSWLQALSIWLFGHTQVALLIWPVLLGVAATISTWLWVRSWFGTQTAWFASILLAATPWAITLSRDGAVFALYPFLVTYVLWAATLAWREFSVRNAALLGIGLVVSLLSGPIGWLLAVCLTLTGFTVALHDKRRFGLDAATLTFGVLGVMGLAGAGFLAATSTSQLGGFATAMGLATTLPAFLGSLGATLLMYNVAGDGNYLHNVSGSPMLNTFVGLMLIAGILVSISRLHGRKYRLLLLITSVMLVPAVAGADTAPDAALASGTLPLVIAIASIGISYMLELWFRTFPINSAARTSGQTAIGLLLVLSVLEGYTQYFHAWASSTQMYAAYNESATQLAKNLMSDAAPAKINRYVVALPSQLRVVDYLAAGKVHYVDETTAGMASLANSHHPIQFWISADVSSAAEKILKQKFPGAVLQPHYSSFSQTEIYYTYEVTK